MIFDVGRESLVRVPMLEPLRGTKAHVGELLDRCPDGAVAHRRARRPALTSGRGPGTPGPLAHALTPSTPAIPELGIAG